MSARPVRVLLVDDNEQLLEMLRLYLTASGFEIVTATDGQAAMDMLDEAAPDIVVTDYKMPRMDGVTLSRSVREHPGFHDTQIVLYSAYDQDQYLTSLIQPPPAAWLRKGSSPDELVRFLNELVAGRQPAV